MNEHLEEELWNQFFIEDNFEKKKLPEFLNELITLGVGIDKEGNILINNDSLSKGNKDSIVISLIARYIANQKDSKIKQTFNLKEFYKMFPYIVEGQIRSRLSELNKNKIVYKRKEEFGIYPHKIGECLKKWKK
jgi:hypothetical protein